MAFEELRIEMKCKDFHIEVEEGLKGESLSIAAQDHAASCHPCREFNQKHVEFREWLMVCEKITAPKNFAFGVQRKIASSSASHSHKWAWSRLRYIVPSTAAMLVLALAGSYMLSPQNTPDNRSAAIIAESESRSTADNPAQVPVEVPAQQTGAPDNAVAAANTKQNKNAPLATQRKEPEGGSIDSGVNPVPSPGLPQGLNLSQKSSIQTKLVRLGVITATDNGGIKVILVKENSGAAGAGVKVGDVVESLNRNVLSVKRGGQTIQIVIK